MINLFYKFIKRGIVALTKIFDLYCFVPYCPDKLELSHYVNKPVYIAIRIPFRNIAVQAGGIDKII